MNQSLRISLANGRKAVFWLQSRLIFAALALVRLLPADAAMNFLAAASRRIGPLLGRHRVALNNLALAMPEIDVSEREKIALDMWENMARLAGEYVFLDDIFDFDPANPGAGRVEVEGVELFERLRKESRPRIFFTAHLGNFELLPIAAATFGLEVTAMFKPPSNPYVAERILSARTTRMGKLVPSKAGAAITLARTLETNGSIGVLVDQRIANGLDTTFFGAPCLTNPLLAKLARQYDCDIHPACCTRLPGGRYRLVLEDKIDIPRDAKGRVDTLALTQAINDHVERWVRAAPGQWMWFHKRWKTSTRRKRGAAVTG
jgi:Kdo2-lipid IVA lauroyltransferase/acyltransferase